MADDTGINAAQAQDGPEFQNGKNNAGDVTPKKSTLNNSSTIEPNDSDPVATKKSIKDDGNRNTGSAKWINFGKPKIIGMYVKTMVIVIMVTVPKHKKINLWNIRNILL